MRHAWIAKKRVFEGDPSLVFGQETKRKNPLSVALAGRNPKNLHVVSPSHQAQLVALSERWFLTLGQLGLWGIEEPFRFIHGCPKTVPFP